MFEPQLAIDALYYNVTFQAFALHWSANLSCLLAVLLSCGILSATEPPPL